MLKLKLTEVLNTHLVDIIGTKSSAEHQKRRARPSGNLAMSLFYVVTMPVTFL